MIGALQQHATGSAEGVRSLPCPVGTGPHPFFIYWRSQRRQFFSYRARVAAGSAAEARARFLPRRGPEPCVVGVKAAAGWGGDAVAQAGRWVG